MLHINSIGKQPKFAVAYVVIIEMCSSHNLYILLHQLHHEGFQYLRGVGVIKFQTTHQSIGFESAGYDKV